MAMDQITALAQLADIVEPTAPIEWPMLLLIPIGMVFIAGFIWKIKRKKTTITSSQTQLKQIQKQWQTGELDDRLTAYWLASILRHHWQLPSLPDTSPDMLTIDEQEWLETIQKLNTLRYKNNNSEQITPYLFKTIKQWLKSNEI